MKDLTRIVDKVFPAHAGMSRIQNLPNWKEPCFPRPRGDEPSLPDPHHPLPWFSPPTRG